MFSIIGNLKTKTFGSVQNVVIGVNWLYSVTLEGCEFLFHGSTDFEYNPESPFIEYNNLTEETVSGWIKSVVTQDELDFYAKKAQEHLDAFKENDNIPEQTNVWAVYTLEQVQETPWASQETVE